MNHLRTEEEFEMLVKKLNTPSELARTKSKYDKYPVSFLPKIMGWMLVHGGSLVYGRAPTYLKFRAVEVIARVPYHSWQAVGFVFLTLFYTNEARALSLAKTEDFARIAQDNETMHVVVISALAKQEQKSGFIRDTLIPLIFATFYFFSSVLLYIVCKRWSFELNYMFEQHAFDQYQLFLAQHEQELKKKPIHSAFLEWYGRHPANQYEFFLSVRNDELIHRNSSIEAIQKTV